MSDVLNAEGVGGGVWEGGFEERMMMRMRESMWMGMRMCKRGGRGWDLLWSFKRRSSLGFGLGDVVGGLGE